MRIKNDTANRVYFIYMKDFSFTSVKVLNCSCINFKKKKKSILVYISHLKNKNQCVLIKEIKMVEENIEYLQTSAKRWKPKSFFLFVCLFCFVFWLQCLELQQKREKRLKAAQQKNHLTSSNPCLMVASFIPSPGALTSRSYLNMWNGQCCHSYFKK